HFGDGCVHVRLDFPLTEPQGVARTRAFLEEAADTVARHGGSISGEHGDGRARSELLSRMYSPSALALFSQVKGIFDPDGLLNPGV
ncbi:FAD-binding oxidoreductase, partial [Streptococcus agalactiae]